MTTLPEQLLSEGYIKISDGIWDKSSNVDGTIVQWLYFYNPEKNHVCTLHETVVMKNKNRDISYVLHQKEAHPFVAQGILIETENVGEYAFVNGWTSEGLRMLEERLKFLGIKWKMYETKKKPALPNEFIVINEADIPVFIFYFNDTIRELPLR